MLEKASTWLPCFLGSRGLIPGGSLLWTGSPFLLFIPWIPFHLPNRGSLNRSHCPKPSTFSLLPSFLVTQHASDVTENSGATEHACTPSTSLFQPQRGPSSACFPQLKFLRRKMRLSLQGGTLYTGDASHSHPKPIPAFLCISGPFSAVAPSSPLGSVLES